LRTVTLAIAAGTGVGAAVGVGAVDIDDDGVVGGDDADAAGAADWAIDAVDSASITKIIYDNIFFIISS
jgi:hypothetical protein